MKGRWVKWYQDYQDGREFGGRSFFGAAARVASVGYAFGRRLHRVLTAGKEKSPFRSRAKVITVGNLTVGGSGKTSLVDYLAARLLASGRSVAILTRGYGRRTKDRIIIHPGEADDYDVSAVGDEPVMLARRLPQATVIVDADRAGAAAAYEKSATVDCFLLDDGFQYRGLASDCALLALIAGDLRPPCRLFPAGRWREPVAGVIRADAAVIATMPGEEILFDRERLAQLGMSGPVFPFAYECAALRNLDGTPAGFLTPPEGSKIGAFCALARPQRFFDWLAAREIPLVWTKRLPDHFAYDRHEVSAITNTAWLNKLDYLITSEKDAVKLARFDCGNVRILYPDVRLVPVDDVVGFDRFLERVFAREPSS